MFITKQQDTVTFLANTSGHHGLQGSREENSHRVGTLKIDIPFTKDDGSIGYNGVALKTYMDKNLSTGNAAAKAALIHAAQYIVAVALSESDYSDLCEIADGSISYTISDTAYTPPA